MTFSEVRDRLIQSLKDRDRLSIFKDFLEMHWKSQELSISAIVNPDNEGRKYFIEWIGQKEHSELVLNLFLNHIQRERDDAGAAIRFLYSKFLETIESHIKSILEKRKNKLTYIAIRIPTLRNNPNGVECSLNDISVGSVVKICDGEERFWVKVVKIGTNELIGKGFGEFIYFGEIINDLICDNGHDRGDVVVFNLAQIYDVEKPARENKPSPDLIFGVERKELINILHECYDELKPMNSDIYEAFVLITGLLKRGMSINQISADLTNSGTLPVARLRSLELDKLALSIIERISRRFNYLFKICLKEFFTKKFVKDDIVKPVLREIIRECNTPEDAQEATFKPGDKVFFIKQRNDNEPYRMNLSLGIVKNWTVCPQGKIQCTFDNLFNIMNVETLGLDVCDSEDVKELINSDDFSKAIVESKTKSVYGDITLCPVDESLFPKLNKILANLESNK